MTDPYKAGVFYTGSFISGQLIPSFEALDRRLAVLVQIEAKPDFAVLTMRESGGTLRYHWADAVGNAMTQSTTLPTDPVITQRFIASPPPPHFLIMTDENLDFRYITMNGSGDLVSSGTFPAQYTQNQGQLFGEYIEFVGDDGQKIYRLTVNSSDVLSLALDRTETKRTQTVYVSNGHPKPYDDVSDILWIEALVTLGDVSNRIQSSETGFGGVAIPQIGNIRIQLASDDFLFLANQSFDGRDVTVFAGFTTDSISLYPVIIRGQTKSADVGLDYIDISFRDHGTLLDRKVQSNTYAGTGNEEGGTELEGTLKPLGYGFVEHATPVLIDTALQLYQLHDGAVHEITFVYEGGITLTTAGNLSTAAALIAYTFSQEEIDNANWVGSEETGLFRLAVQPTGPITCSFFGDVAVPRSNNAAGLIAEALVNRVAPEITVDSNKLSEFISDVPGANGLYITNETRLKEVLDRLTRPIGAFATLSRLNTLAMRQLRRREPVAILTDREWVEEGFVSKRDAPTPGRKYRIGYRKVWTTFTESDFLGAAPGSIRAIMQHDYRYVTATTGDDIAGNATRYDSSSTVTYDTLLRQQVDAQRVADELATRDSHLHYLYDITVAGFSWSFEIGDTVLLELEKWEMMQARAGVILEILERSPTSTSEDQTRLLIWA